MALWAGPRYRNRGKSSARRQAVAPPRKRWNLACLPRRARPRPATAPEAELASLPPGKRDERLQALEAVLFLANEPLNTRKIAQFANLADGTEALTLIRQLNRFYESEGRAFRVEQVAGGYQLMTHPALADWLRRLAGTPAEVRLSTPALETLAVVAYRQPVQRAEVEAIRGVACGEMLRQLMERDLIRIEGRSEELGRPFLYGTTNRFLHVFGLASIDELPRAESLRHALTAEPSSLAGQTQPSESHERQQQGPDSGSAPTEMKESNTVTATIGDVRPLTPPGENYPVDEDAPANVVAEIDDDDELDDFDDDDEFDDDEDDFDDEFDDDYDDDEWDDDEFDDELEDDLEEDEWEEVEDDEDDVDEEDDDEDEDWGDDEEDEDPETP